MLILFYFDICKFLLFTAGNRYLGNPFFRHQTYLYNLIGEKTKNKDYKLWIYYTFKGHGTVETVVGSDLVLPGIIKYWYIDICLLSTFLCDKERIGFLHLMF